MEIASNQMPSERKAMTLQATLPPPAPEAPSKEKWRPIPPVRRRLFQSESDITLLVSLVLVLATVAAYAPSLRNGFVSFDDQLYVTQNPAVLSGLTWGGFLWALRTTAVDYWHPLTWLVHMAAVQAFGLNATGHHLISLLLHVFNVVFLFYLLRRATGLMWRAAIVAALFALFPLNVESVAWVAETKTLLCTAFLLMALWAYGWYARRASVVRYFTVAALFLLGLMAKPLLVTLPVALLLVDFWPLQRLGARDESAPSGVESASLARLVLEKVPLLGLSLACALSTTRSQRIVGAVVTTSTYPISWRVKNSIWSYADYLYKAIWPTHLAAFYPYEGRTLSQLRVTLAAATLVAISVILWRLRRKKYLVVGWLWYLLMLLPVIGIIQAGSQGMADRYAYIPFLGIFAAVVWFLADESASLHISRSLIAATCGCILAVYGAVAFFQVRVWHDSLSLFTHMAKAVPQNAFAEENLGQLLMEAGRPQEALCHYEAAAKYMPTASMVHYNLGAILQGEGRLDEAVKEYRLAIEHETTGPMLSTELDNIGSTYARMNRLSDALKAFSAAIRENPQEALPYKNRGLLEYSQNNLPGARDDLAAAARLTPEAQTYYWLGRVLQDEGDAKSAVDNYNAALRLQPGMSDAENRLAQLSRK